MAQEKIARKTSEKTPNLKAEIHFATESKYPPAEPGALGIGPLEAAVGVADATPNSLPPEGGRLTPQIHLLQAAVLLLLISDVLPYHRFVSTYGRDEVPSCPEMLPYKIALLLSVYTGQMDRALIDFQLTYLGQAAISVVLP